MKKQIRISFILIIALSLTVSSNISAAAEKLPYACVIRVTERNWVNAFKFANTLLYADYPVYWAASRFNIGADIFEAGDFVVPVADTRDPKKTVAFVSTVGKELNLDVKSYDTQFDAILYPLRPIKVAICAHNGTMWGYYVEVVRGLGFKVDLITELDIKAGLLTLDRYDAFCLPGGSTAWMMVTLGEDGCKKIEEFVFNGGGYIGSCAAAYMTAYGDPYMLKGWPEKAWLQLGNWRVWNIDTTGTYTSFWQPLFCPRPGIGIFEFKNVAPSHPVMFGMPEVVPITWWQGPIMEPVPGALKDRSDPTVLLTVYNWTPNITPREWYYNGTGWKIATAEEKSNTTIGRGMGLAAVIAGYFGKGKVVSCGPHPEFGLRLTIDNFDYAARIIGNTLLWTASSPSAVASLKERRYWSSVSSPQQFRVEQGLVLVKEKANTLRSLAEDLKKLPTEPLPNWLSENYLSIFGITPQEQWRHYMDALPRIITQLNSVSDELSKQIIELQKCLKNLTNIESKLIELKKAGFSCEQELIQVQNLIQLTSDEIKSISDDINAVYPAEWRPQPGVRQGALFLLDRMISTLRSAKTTLADASAKMDASGMMRSAIADIIYSLAMIRSDVTSAWITKTIVEHKLLDINELISALEKLPKPLTSSELASELGKLPKPVTSSELTSALDKLPKPVTTTEMTGIYATSVLIGLAGVLVGAFVTYLVLKKKISK